jgi:hypothetical protein
VVGVHVFLGVKGAVKFAAMELAGFAGGGVNAVFNVGGGQALILLRPLGAADGGHSKGAHPSDGPFGSVVGFNGLCFCGSPPCGRFGHSWSGSLR